MPMAGLENLYNIVMMEVYVGLNLMIQALFGQPAQLNMLKNADILITYGYRKPYGIRVSISKDLGRKCKDPLHFLEN